MELLLRSGLRAELEMQARAAWPRECCGLLEGVRRAAAIEVSRVHAVTNAATGHDRFELDPAEHIRLLRDARTTGRELIGCYHSHPNGRPELSSLDREHAIEEGFVWLIVSLPAPDAPVTLGAFLRSNGTIESLEVASDAAIA